MSLLDEDEVRKALNNYLGREVDRINNFRLAPLTESTVGYLGNHLSLTIDYAFDGEDNRKKRFFVKSHDSSERETHFLDETGIFQKEVDFYMVIVEEVRKSVGEPKWCPRPCFSKRRALGLYYFLEDLTENHFTMAESGFTLDEGHIRMALKTMSRMHASSMLLERIKGQSLPTAYPELFREILYDETKPRSPTARWVTWQIDDLLVAIEYLDKYSDDEKIRIKEKFNDAIRRVYPLNKQSTKYRNVLTHGDVWKNNLMFKYDGDASPIDGRLVDYQFFRYAPPAHDVMHFLHFATRRADRDKNKNTYLDVYYENLSEEIESAGMRVQDLVTRDEFFESCSHYRELAVIQCLLSLHYILGPVTLNTDDSNYDKYEEYLSVRRKDYMKEFFARESYADTITEGLCELIDGYIMKNP